MPASASERPSKHGLQHLAQWQLTDHNDGCLGGCEMRMRERERERERERGNWDLGEL
jgi:hypothetical protein